MGIVYAAYDEKLDRRVALKVLRKLGSGSEKQGRRMLREAQALARLSHPNVVQVHDVGSFGAGQVFLAMEYLRGTTLRAWLDQGPRDWRVVLAAFVQAGRGLAAAHAAGLVHRDFKPDNVIVGEDGRVRVVDFGLAGALHDGSETSQSDEDEAALRDSALDLRLTRSGARIGTPAYMSPEQHMALPVDAYSDQFGFCVALWEGLFGERPFIGETIADVRALIVSGRHRPAPRSRLPARLIRAIERGLSVDPRDRWPSMTVLLDELTAAPRRSARLWLAGGLLATLAGAAAGVVIERSWRGAACDAAGAPMAATWSPEAAGAVSSAIRATRVAHADVAAAQAGEQLERYAADWSRARVRLCELAEEEGALTEQLYARARVCLDERLVEFDALVEGLRRSGPAQVHLAVGAAAGLSLPSPCLDVAWLQRRPAEPQPAASVAARDNLARALALRALGRFGEAEAAVALAEQTAVTTGPVALLRRARIVRGLVLADRGDRPAARVALEGALQDAGAEQDDDNAFDAALALAELDGLDRTDVLSAMSFVRLAEMWLTRLGVAPEDLRYADLWGVRGRIRLRDGQTEEARADLTRARELLARVLGPEHPRVAAVRTDDSPGGPPRSAP
mgnify:CR=1 FL=1